MPGSRKSGAPRPADEPVPTTTREPSGRVPAEREIPGSTGSTTGSKTRPAAEPLGSLTREWTPQQRAGIETIGTGLLVSAAAGSGKTAVLSERCAYVVCDASDPCDVDELLVVT